MHNPPTPKSRPGLIPRLKINTASIAVLAALSLFLALVPVLMIQYQQSRVMQIGATSRVDSVLWITYQFEREHGRLRTALRNVIESPTPGSQQELILKYDIFYSRFDLVKTSPSLEYLHKTPEYRAVIDALSAFVKKADPVIAGLGTQLVNVSEIKDLLRQANKDEEALRDMTNFSTNVVSKEIDGRNSTIQNQGLWIFLLAALQWLILSGALIGFILYVRRQRLHNLELTKFSRRLHQASRKADSANHAKSVFLANMSHELRTPFQGLLGMLNLLSDTSLSSAQQEYTQTALVSARHLLGILNDILDISTIESGAMKLRLAPVHVGNLVGEVESLMQASARDKQIDLHIQIDPLLPAWIEADATRLTQILFNLLSNAIKFTDAGVIAMQLSLVQSNPAHGEQVMQISIQDTGVGMDAGTLAGLFSRFHQADPSMQRRHGGTGLGLEITRNLTHMMGGQINVQSKLGLGTTFIVTLPLRASNAPKAIASSLQAPLALQQMRSLRVLIADDHVVNVKYLKIVLERMGHDADSCENGAQVLERLQTQSYDVILMDLHMPVMDGISATRAVRQLANAAASTKIIMVSADILNATRQSALEAGVDGFVAKPIQERGLRKALALVDPASYVSYLDDTTLPPAPRKSTPTPSSTTQMQWVHAATYQDFIDLMPQETVKKQLLSMFGAGHNDIQAIATALMQGNRSEAGRLAHQLNGVCMLMGLTTLGHTLASIEKAATAATHEVLPAALHERLLHYAKATQEAIETLNLAANLA
jgi:two-component system, sensor histidine kinase